MTLFRIIFSVALVVLQSCGCGSSSGRTYRIGVDPNWFPLNFGPQVSYVNGYVEDLLIEIARYSGVQFEKIVGNPGDLLEGLRTEKYDAVLSSMEPYEYNRAKYDFSHSFLDIGPVLIVPFDLKRMELDGPNGAVVGIIEGAPSALILGKYPAIVIRTFKTIPDLLNAVVNGQIEGALLGRIPAVNYVEDLYAGKLHIVGKPLTDAGLRCVSLKGNDRIIRIFNKSIERTKKNNTLLKKWKL